MSAVAMFRVPTRGRHHHLDALVEQLMEARPGEFRGRPTEPSVHTDDLAYAPGEAWASQYNARLAMLYLAHQYGAVKPTNPDWRKTETWSVKVDGLGRYMRGERVVCPVSSQGAGRCPCGGAFPRERGE